MNTQQTTHFIPPEMLPPEQRLTTWRNPSDREVVLDLWVGAHVGNKSGRLRWRLAPGASAQIPSEYDAGIQDVRDGVIVGGHGPQLERIGGPPRRLHPSLDERLARAKRVEEDALKALAQRMVSDQALAAALEEQKRILSSEGPIEMNLARPVTHVASVMSDDELDAATRPSSGPEQAPLIPSPVTGAQRGIDPRESGKRQK